MEKKDVIYAKIKNNSSRAHKTASNRCSLKFLQLRIHCLIKVSLDLYSQDDEPLDSVYMDQLYQMHESAYILADNDTTVYSTIIEVLRGINPYDMINLYERDKKVTHLALIIIPTKYWNKNFINEKLQPVFIRAEWISFNDDDSKIIFSNELQCRIISLQNEKKVLIRDRNNSLRRERKYISCCCIQCIISHKAKITLLLYL